MSFQFLMMMMTIITIVSFTLYPCLDVLQGKEPTAGEPLKKSQGVSSISLPLLWSFAPQGRYVRVTQVVSDLELHPNFREAQNLPLLCLGDSSEDFLAAGTPKQ